MQTTVETMQTGYDLKKFAILHSLTAQLYLKFLLITHHKVLFIKHE